jgi:ArsR family transcriptional regulator
MERQDALAALAALAHGTRLDVFRLLVEAGPEGLPAGTIADELSVPAPTLSFHLKELRNAALVRSDRDGRSLVYAPDFGAMRALVGFLTRNCCGGSC